MISDAQKELKELAEKIEAPVGDTLMGKGAFVGTDEKYTGMAGMHGTKATNLGITECDLLIAVGARFSDRVVGNCTKLPRMQRFFILTLIPLKLTRILW